jgi:hypothetical protein
MFNWCSVDKINNFANIKFLEVLLCFNRFSRKLHYQCNFHYSLNCSCNRDNHFRHINVDGPMQKVKFGFNCHGDTNISSCNSKFPIVNFFFNGLSTFVG